MIYSKDGLALTEQFESCVCVAYQDVKGVWTIGWGHTGPEVREGLVWTRAEADAALLRDCAHAEAAVNKVTQPLTQHEFDALVDFVFNLGVATFERSSLLKFINAGNLRAAADEFEKWDHASGKVVQGLLRRRLAEKSEFIAGHPS